MTTGIQRSHPAEQAISPPPVAPPGGWTEADVLKLREQFGPNAIEAHPESPLRKFARFFWGPIPFMIEAAAILSAIVRHYEDLLLILFMLFLNAAVGFWEEHKADTAIAALRRHLAPRARVLREGHFHEIDAAELVPGDIVQIRLGNIVPADLSISSDSLVEVDQSVLTGESLPVEKGRGDAAYSGSIVRTGEATAVVTATGEHTLFGKTARLVETAGARSHFQRAVLQIGNFLIAVTLVLAATIVFFALFRREPLIETLTFVLILAVAAIPVALPAVLSVTMAAGAHRLATMKAIVSRLVSIEELAGMDILCCDKTGTLTQNQLAAADPVVLEAAGPDEVLLWGALASRADGDPMDNAVRSALSLPERCLEYDQIEFTPFDPVHKRSLAEVTKDGRSFTVTKGAPQVILALAAPPAEVSSRARAEVDRLATTGYRTLAVARREHGSPWELLGLLPFLDPPREDARGTIAELARMGLSVRMLTGDNLAIAREMSKRLGLTGPVARATDIFSAGGAADKASLERVVSFAEVLPEHKLTLVRELQSQGHIVGMTGDGVNDAPALQQADAGIAVSGATDAAKSAADLVLTAPGLRVIASAVEEARRIFERMTSYATFRIAETIRVLLFMSLSILLFGFYPVTAVMIVLLAVLNDLPIMTIAYDNTRVAERPVRWDMPRVLTVSGVLGVTGVCGSFTLFWFVRDWLHLHEDHIRTLIFLKLLVAGHLTIYVARNDGPLWQRPFPAAKLLTATFFTMLIGTLAAALGWLVVPIGWKWAGLVWVYALVWMGISSAAKIATLRLLALGTAAHRRHLTRVTGRLHPPPVPG